MLLYQLATEINQLLQRNATLEVALVNVMLKNKKHVVSAPIDELSAIGQRYQLNIQRDNKKIVIGLMDMTKVIETEPVIQLDPPPEQIELPFENLPGDPDIGE